jgi:hypothetical protein
MIPPFIIEQIRRREEAERRKKEAERPRLELPIDAHRPAREPTPRVHEEELQRGVVIVEL